MKNSIKGLSTKEIDNNYKVLQEQYLADIDLSGGLYIEFQKLEPKTIKAKNKLMLIVTFNKKRE